MTSVLVLGATGMLGHKAWQELSSGFDCWATVRADSLEGPAAEVLDPDRTVTRVRVEDPSSVAEALRRTRVDVVVNCVGVVKQADAAADAPRMIRTNALFPHELAAACRAHGVRMIQVSTDCVFSGERGGYREGDVPDARDLYGRSKLLGEVEVEGSLTLRTSIVGRELSGAHGLVEWFLSQRGGTVRGFERAVFSGVTTAVLSQEIAHLIEERPDLSGVWHLAADPVAKHELLLLLRDAFELDVKIVPDDSLIIDRSLDARRLREETGRCPPSWSEMVQALAADPTPYESLRAGAALTSPVASR